MTLCTPQLGGGGPLASRGSCLSSLATAVRTLAVLKALAEFKPVTVIVALFELRCQLAETLAVNELEKGNIVCLSVGCQMSRTDVSRSWCARTGKSQRGKVQGLMGYGPWIGGRASFVGQVDKRTRERSMTLHMPTHKCSWQRGTTKTCQIDQVGAFRWSGCLPCRELLLLQIMVARRLSGCRCALRAASCRAQSLEQRAFPFPLLGKRFQPLCHYCSKRLSTGSYIED